MTGPLCVDAFPALGHSASTPHLASSQTQAPGAQWQAASARTTSASPSRPSATTADDFPSLPQSRGPDPLQVPSFPAAAPRATANATASRRGASGSLRPQSQDEFPALVGAGPAARSAAPQEQHLQRSFADEAAAGSSAVGGISEGLKAANKVAIRTFSRSIWQSGIWFGSAPRLYLENCRRDDACADAWRRSS